ncbi:MAG: ABC transporter ATP-binding protein [candidate division Zixibacteria bacterium]|nr:ABC transporter ATP-binding protein [candidate division Zixibacteria bacterium]
MNSSQQENCILRSDNIHRGFSTPQGRIEVLKGITLELERGEMVAVLGASGVGKTTLLHLLGGLDRPDEGDIYFHDKPYSSMSEAELAVFRNRHIGFIFQFHYLLSEFSALENVMMPLLIAGKSHPEASERAELLLDDVGLKDRISHLPAELSGGEQQRVAVARALALEPDIVLADEPSGNLDVKTGHKLHELLVELNNVKKTSFAIATHNLPLADLCGRVIHLSNGEKE